MRANTGGQIAPKDVVGRDQLIERIWRALEQQSVVLTAARRMGKTSILRKMEADARQLALLLLSGENIVTADAQATAREIAQSADNVAFYIHHVVDRLTDWQGDINSSAVLETVSAFLMDAQGAWDMRHYRKRIDTYYLPSEQPIALRLLDVCARAEQPLTQSDILNGAASQIENLDVEQARTVLDSLLRDHYLTRQADGTYQFYLPLIRRWWRMERGL